MRRRCKASNGCQSASMCGQTTSRRGWIASLETRQQRAGEAVKREKETRQKAEEAVKRAKEARQKAEEAAKRAKEARQKAEEAVKQAIDAGLRAAQLNSEQQRLDIEQERLASVRNESLKRLERQACIKSCIEAVQCTASNRASTTRSRRCSASRRCCKQGADA